MKSDRVLFLLQKAIAALIAFAVGCIGAGIGWTLLVPAPIELGGSLWHTLLELLEAIS